MTFDSIHCRGGVLCALLLKSAKDTICVSRVGWIWCLLFIDRMRSFLFVLSDVQTPIRADNDETTYS